MKFKQPKLCDWCGHHTATKFVVYATEAPVTNHWRGTCYVKADYDYMANLSMFAS